MLDTSCNVYLVNIRRWLGPHNISISTTHIDSVEPGTVPYHKAWTYFVWIVEMERPKETKQAGARRGQGGGATTICFKGCEKLTTVFLVVRT